MKQNTTIFCKLFFLLVFLILLNDQTQAQIDKEFWFAPPDLTMGTPSEAANPGSRRDRPIKIVASTINEPAVVTIWQPANLSFQPIVLNIATASSATADLTNFLNQIETTIPDSIMKTGILVRSTAPITCYYELGAGANRELISLKGKNANGKLFYTPFQTLYVNARTLGGQLYGPQPRAGIVIIATDDTTNVTITPKVDILNHLAGIPFTVQLMRGETYYCEAIDYEPANRPAGTKIVSDKPIAVTLKDDMIDIMPPGVPGGGEGGADLAADQMISEDKIGLKHIVVKGHLVGQGEDFDRVFVMAYSDSTDIFVNGNPVPVATLMTGEQYIHRFNTDQSSVIEGSKKIQLWHLSGSADQVAADVIPSLECTGSNQVGFTRAASGGTLRMTLTIKAGYESGFVLNGTPMNVNDFQPVNGSNGEYVFLHRIFSNTEIPAGSGSLVTNFGAELFHMSLLYDLGPSCNYGYFSDFSYLNLGTTRSLCLGDSAVLDAGPGKTEYTWSTGDTTQKITVFDPGTYYVFVRSGNQCTAADTIEVEYYSPAVRIEASRDTICEGTQLLLTVPGSFLFKWQDNSTNPFFIASDSGIYYVEVTDYQGCRARDSIRIYTAPRPLTPIATILPFDSSVTSDSLCVGESVTLEMSTLQGATYAWIGPNNSLYTGSELSFPAINPTNSGQYLAYNIVDGCESLYDTLNLIVKPTPEVYIGETDTVCSVENLLLDAGAGSGYTYLWQDESTNQTFTANAPGLYWVEVSNPEGCSKRDSVRLVFSTRPVTPDIQIGGNSASAYSGCEGTDVTLGLSALSGGQYFWITPAPSDTIQSPGTSFPITNLDSMNQGVYYAYYKSNGCKSTLDSLTLTVNLKPPFNSPFSDTSICGTGSIVLDAGSSPDVTFRWSDNSTGSTITVTEQGTYWVEIKNSNNCVNSDTVEIGGGEIPSTPTVEGDSTLCTGDTLVLTISNAQSGATYVWNGPTGTINTATLNLPNAEAGTYEVFANLDGCYSADTASFQVSLDSIPNVDVGADTLICGGQTVILVANSSSNVTFSWSNNTTESTLSVTTPGTYWVEVRNNAGCVASDSAVVGDSGSPVTPVVEGDRDLCIGESLILSVTNTQSGVSYVWNGPSGTINSSTLNLPLPGPGTYEVFALLNGCYSFDTTSLQISINQYPDFNLGSDTVICGVNSTQLNGPDGYMTYVWSNGDTTQQTTLVAGQNTLTVTSLAGCVGSDTIILSIGNPVAAFSSSPESGALLGTPVNYTDQSLGAPILWNWSFGDNQGASNQNVSHAFQSEGTKTVTLIITDQAGCTDTTSKVIEISNSVAVPNSFTPNADGKNDFFAVKGLSAFPNSKLIIFNRWGSEIYNSSDYDNKWDGGKYPDGVYFYILELTSGETLKGDVTILRN